MDNGGVNLWVQANGESFPTCARCERGKEKPLHIFIPSGVPTLAPPFPGACLKVRHSPQGRFFNHPKALFGKAKGTPI